MPNVLIVTVNYKAADATARFLASVGGLEGFSCADVIVVENGSDDGSAEILPPLARQFGNVELLESPVNRGYFGAAKWALQTYLAHTPVPDWIVVCNNDIVFDDHEFLEKLFHRDPAAAGVIAPAIVAKQTGIDCNPFLRTRPTPAQLLGYQFWQSNYYLMWCKQLLSPYVRRLRHLLHRSSADVAPSGPVKVYAAHGAFLIFSRSYFDRGGYIDDGFFLYAEEFSVAEICLRLGLPIVHDPDLRVWHDAHRVTGRLCNRISFQQGSDGFHYALRNYFNPPDRSISPSLVIPARGQVGSREPHLDSIGARNS
jgi:GT2 family glycosyltransferase